MTSGKRINRVSFQPLALLGVLAAMATLLLSLSAIHGATVLSDDFNGSASTGIVSGVTFTADTAVFDSQADGIEYASSLFPAQGTLEVLLRVDQVGGGANGATTFHSSTILDSAGADGRNQGDIYFVLRDTGIIQFALAPVGGVNPSQQIQVTSSTSILDGQFHAVAISYGSEGIKLFIDGTLEDSDPFNGMRNTSRVVSLGDFKESGFNPASFTFGFIGEVDAIRVSNVQSDLALVTSQPTTNNAPVAVDDAYSVDQDSVLASRFVEPFDTLDPGTWTTFGTGTVQIKSGKLFVQTGISNTGVTGTQAINGDFDITVEFSEFLHDIAGDINFGALTMQLRSALTPLSNAINLERRSRGGTQQRIFSDFILNGSHTAFSAGGVTSPSGQLRAVRTGDTIELMFRNSATASWSLLTTQTWVTDPVQIVLFARNDGRGGRASGKFDNFTLPGVANLLDNDSEVDGDPLTAALVTGPSNGTLTLKADGSFTYTSVAGFNGVDTFTYKVNDGTADSNMATVTITVNPINDALVAGSPPTGDAGPDQTVEWTLGGVSVTLDGSGSSDPDDDSLTFTWAGRFPEGGGTVTGASPTVTLTSLGDQTITLTVDDGNGGTDTDTVIITVEDTTSPEITVSVSPDTLWPPNHKMVEVLATVNVRDTGDPLPTVVLTSVVSDEPDDAPRGGDGKTTNDIQGADLGTDDREFFLRAERAGRGDGRVYAITYTVTDGSGNSASATATVTVPHDLR